MPRIVSPGLSRQVLDRIHMLATAIIALAGITLGILVRHQRTLGRQDRGTGKIFGGNQQQLVALTLLFGIDGGIHFRVGGL
jgi:hypothetical protein